MDTGLVIKKYIPSLALFIIGYIVSAKYIWDPSMGFVGGWLLGGIVWGWYLTRKWFGPSHFVSFSVIWIIGFAFKFALAAMVGLVALPIGIIQLIIALFVTGKKASDAVNVNQRQSTVSYNTPSTQSVNQPVINTGETWVCKECEKENPITSSTCKGCGAYK